MLSVKLINNVSAKSDYRIECGDIVEIVTDCSTYYDLLVSSYSGLKLVGFEGKRWGDTQFRADASALEFIKDLRCDSVFNNVKSVRVFPKDAVTISVTLDESQAITE